MEHDAVRELTAAYALDALEPDDEREVEAHLRVCERCREELAAFTEAATALAYGVAAPAPSPALRDRILGEVRGERSNVVPFRPRRLPVVVSSVAAAAATVAAVGLGLWAKSLSDSLERERAAAEILADPAARSIPVRGAQGRLVVAQDGEAALVVAGLERAPAGKTYEVWVIRGAKPVRAGLFEGERERDVVELTHPVSRGAIVAVTVERDGGVEEPTSRPLFSARA